MSAILYNISQVIGITIIHSLWQALLIYFLLRITFTAARDLSASKKYKIAVTALAGITGWFVVTLINEVQAYDWSTVPAGGTEVLIDLPANVHKLNQQGMRYYYSIQQYLPYISVLYTFGLLFNSARALVARRQIRIVKQTMSLDVQLQQQISRFAKKFGIAKKVTVGLSRLVDVPCITGYVKPVILLPFSLATYLNADEIEAILMHELAHIKRNDYLVNLAQQVITAILFFNPCVLLINKIIGEERENACDDMVVDATQNPIIYAKALYKLEQTRQNTLQLALAVTGKKYHLLNRIERIMKTKKQTLSVRPTVVAMLILTVSISALTILKPEVAQGRISVKAIVPAIKQLVTQTDTVPVKKATQVVTSDKGTAAAKKAAAKNRSRTVRVQQFGQTYEGLNDPELSRLSKDIEKQGELISQYYESADFKAKTADMERLGKQISAFYESDAVKKATAAQEKAAADYEKAWSGKGSKIEELGKQMSAAGDVMSKYYESKEFKDMNAKLAKKYNIPEKTYYNKNEYQSENYKAYQAELNKNIPADVLAQQDKMKELGQQMRKYTEDPELKKQQELMRQYGDEMRKVYNNPAIKDQQEQMRKLGMQMHQYGNSQQIKAIKEQMRVANLKLRAYMNTPEFKKKLAAYKKQYRIYSDNVEVDEVPERAEQPEKTEPAEAPEKTENN
ncbi:M56 family metallopeptidase [Mucilaginibacter pallidiroseus]|uniref:M56 family metallopeptidase n=1 Tax=Mucilaginibacter pallidiroseus TaxID=2599295 RepID=A0A563UG46_9SPHI|nr:M56 family metallopeptidase [Mucilaginibacter pallidiroseus]TWR30243.1 M56 family metallopeptidase [Mucilaginibacter pallidiroseus]